MRILFHCGPPLAAHVLPRPSFPSVLSRLALRRDRGRLEIKIRRARHAATDPPVTHADGRGGTGGRRAKREPCLRYTASPRTKYAPRTSILIPMRSASDSCNHIFFFMRFEKVEGNMRDCRKLKNIKLRTNIKDGCPSRRMLVRKYFNCLFRDISNFDN